MFMRTLLAFLHPDSGKFKSYTNQGRFTYEFARETFSMEWWTHQFIRRPGWWSSSWILASSPTLSLPPIEAEPEVNIQFVCSLILALSIGQSVMKIDWRWSLFRHCFFFLNDCIVSHLTQFSSTIDRWGDFKPLWFKLLTHPWNPVLFTIMNSLTQSDPVSLLYQKNILSS